MEKKKKRFKPVITRVELNPEQAVLQCSCYDAGYVYSFSFAGGNNSSCDPDNKTSSYFGDTYNFSSSIS